MDQAKAPALSSDPQTLKLAEHRRNQWSVVAPMGVTPERALEVDYWVHCVNRIKEGDVVEMFAIDGSWYAQYVVDKVTPTIGIRMWQVLLADRRVVASEAAPAALAAEDRGAESDYEVAFGGAHRWRVVRISDKAVVHKGEASEGDARTWLKEYLAGAEV